MSALLSLMPFLGEFALFILRKYMESDQNSTERLQYFIEAVEALRAKGLEQVRSRLGAEDGKKEAEDQWSKIEKEQLGTNGKSEKKDG